MNTITGRRVIAASAAALVFCMAFLTFGFTGSDFAPVMADSLTQAPSPGTPTMMGNSNSSQSIPLTGNQTTPISHIMRPGTPPVYGPTLNDSDSSTTAAQHYPSGGDNFNINLFERPFNANTQDTYFPQVDILQSAMVNGSPWVYGSIALKGVDPSTNQLDASYALELDLNLDGRGDVLVVANNPVQGDWSTNGVQVFLDPDQDVGGATPLHPDAAATPGEGYEQKVFDSGVGNDPDLAWSMVSATRPNVVWFAFKSDLTNNSAKWMWGAWAQNGGLHPELFDYNDHMSLADAGYPIPGNADYPLKALAEVDNTCRWAVGFTPTGSEPGLCALPATPAPFLPAFTVTNTPRPTSSSLPTETPTPGPSPTRVFHFPTVIRATFIFASTPTPTKPVILRTPTRERFCNPNIPAFKCTLVAP